MKSARIGLRMGDAEFSKGATVAVQVKLGKISYTFVD